jgi:hypothetical protein
MNKKIREKFYSWDLRSVFLTIIFCSAGLFLFFYFTDIRDRFREEDKEKFKGQTNGEIISIQPVERISHSKWKGTKIYIESYKVLYRYNINGKEYERTDNIPLTTRNQKLLTKLLDRKANDIFFVKFDLSDPQKSILIEGE